MNTAQLASKRFADVMAIVLTSPLVLLVIGLIALITRILQGSPVFFRQERAGLHMKPFNLYKFRTMRSDTNPFGPSPKTGRDPRLTGLGRFLRTTSLDELPQVWNVLKGDMSLVGPRPLYMEQAREWNDRQRRRLEVKPGLTGLAQIRGRATLTIEDKLELDVQYVEQQSLWLDLKILFLTLINLFRSSGIYEKDYSRTEHTRGVKR